MGPISTEVQYIVQYSRSLTQFQAAEAAAKGSTAASMMIDCLGSDMKSIFSST